MICRKLLLKEDKPVVPAVSLCVFLLATFKNPPSLEELMDGDLIFKLYKEIPNSRSFNKPISNSLLNYQLF